MHTRPFAVVVGGALLAVVAPLTVTTSAGALAPTTTASRSTPTTADAPSPARPGPDVRRPTPDVTFTSTRGSGYARDVITCAGNFRGGKPYDGPHPGKSSQRRAINAHLDIRCTGGGAGATLVTVTSVMVDGRRVGAGDQESGLRRARTGGDLRCVPKRRAYQAKGAVSIKFPPRYDPPTAASQPVSRIAVFRRGPDGKCVRP